MYFWNFNSSIFCVAASQTNILISKALKKCTRGGDSTPNSN